MSHGVAEPKGRTFLTKSNINSTIYQHQLSVILERHCGHNAAMQSETASLLDPNFTAIL